MNTTAVRKYVGLLRDRDTTARALDYATKSRQEAQGLRRNWVGSEKFRNRFNEQQAKLPVEDRVTYADHLARETVRLGSQEQQAFEQVTLFSKNLTAKEDLLTAFVKDNEDIGALSLEAALAMLDIDPSSDVTPIGKLADAAASEIANTERTEAHLSSKS